MASIIVKNFSDLGMSAKRWMSSFLAPAKEITQDKTWMYGAGTTTVASLLQSGRYQARQRQQIYDKFAEMERSPICATAIGLNVTAALGGNENSGKLVFIEKSPKIQDDKKMAALVEELDEEIGPILNKIARQVAFVGCVFGDSFARLYTQPRVGIIDIYTDEMVRPQLVQAYEQGSRTVGYALYLGSQNFERLDVTQLARLKMPRTSWIPQYGVIEKNLKLAITENDIENLLVMPSMVGGSFLYTAEEPYDSLTSTMIGMVGQRWIDSIDEQMVSVNLEGMTKDQQTLFLESLKTMLTKSKQLAEQAFSSSQPIMERIRHIIPVFKEKQFTQIGPANGGQPGRAGSMSIDDVMFHAKRLSGAFGVDLSLLGFADLLSGGLGEGGFFRVSAQMAEHSRQIRNSLSEFFDHVIDMHCMARYGVVFENRKRPWQINYYGSISALEKEKQATVMDSMNAGLLLVGAMQQFKDMGADEKMMFDFLSHQMKLDEERAKLYAAIVNAKPEGEEGQDGNQPGGGGFPPPAKPPNMPKVGAKAA